MGSTTEPGIHDFGDYNATLIKRLFYEKERISHITNIVVLGVAALVYTCK